ncbi:MAG: ThuA domain-containing protein [Pirellulales bacterium]|jgi:type 1 glutamine amidotransferase
MSWRNHVLALVLSVCCVSFACGEAAKKKLLLVGQGPDGHPPKTHEFMAGLAVLEKCLAPVAGLEIKTVKADGAWPEGPGLLDAADGVVLYVSEGAKWAQAAPGRIEALEKLAARGGGIVTLHWGIGAKDAKYLPRYIRLTGACHGGEDRKYIVFDKEQNVRIANRKHPIASGVSDFMLRDEFYYRLKLAEPKDAIRPVLRVSIEGGPEMVAWSWERPDGGRAFGFGGMHFHANWGVEPCRRLVAQGVLWTLKMPIPEKGLAVDVPEESLKLK